MKRNLNSLRKLAQKLSPLNYSKLSDEQKFNILDEILFFKNEKKTAPFLNKITGQIESVEARAHELSSAARSYQEGSNFIRARRIEKIIQNPVAQDFWEAPIQFAKKGRINNKEDRVLYLTCNISTAKKETHIDPENLYNINFYTSTEDIEVTEIGFQLKGKAHRDCIDKAIINLLHDLFLRQGEVIYDISRFIATRYFNHTHDGWVYPSVANNYSSDNLCLPIKVKSKLKLVAAFAFNKSTPIAKYDVSDINDIKTTTDGSVIGSWDDFCNKSGFFGASKVSQEPSASFLIKQLSNFRS